jgi:pimeloyl-ACP methyl ester carboxylesterase
MANRKPITTKTQVETGYAPINGLEMYYEIHGAGEPLLLLHGQFASIEMFSRILPALAKSRHVIAAEQHPSMVRRLAVSSAAYDIDGYVPQIKEGLLHPRPDAFPAIIRESYERVAPKPDQWPALVAKAGEQAAAQRGLTAAQLSSITAPLWSSRRSAT